jgi:hypothetical protein
MARPVPKGSTLDRTSLSQRYLTAETVRAFDAPGLR